MKKILFILFLTSSVVFGWTGDMIINGTSYNLSPNTEYTRPDWSNANLSGVTLSNCTFKFNNGNSYGSINFSNADLSNVRFIDYYSLGGAQYTFLFPDVNFYNANLRGISSRQPEGESDVYLDEISFQRGNFDYADLRNCDIRLRLHGNSVTMSSAVHANFSDSIFYRSSFTYADLSNAIFKNTTFKNVTNFENSILSYSDFSDTSFIEGGENDLSFNYSTMFEVNFSNASIINGQFRNVNASRANFTGADLTNADFYFATLVGADFFNSVLLGANFEQADLSYAHFRNANLAGMSLKNTNLQGADFTGANLTNVDLTGANLTDTIFDSAVVGGITSFLSFQTQDEKAVLTSASNTIMNLQQSLQLASNTISQLEQSSVSTNQAMAMMRDLRVGSQTFSVSNGNAKIRMYVDESGNLTDWTNTPHVLELDIPADTDTKFFRFRMD